MRLFHRTRVTLCSTGLVNPADAKTLAELTIAQRRELLSLYRFERPPHYSTYYSFDAWVYAMDWPQTTDALPMLGKANLVAQEFKFAFNAWSFLRLALFYGLPFPKVLTHMNRTTPNMQYHANSNTMFYYHCHVNGVLNPRACKVALTPQHPQAVDLRDVDWQRLQMSAVDGIELVVGHENGMSAEVCEGCDAWVRIPQCGSVGSLSMMSAMSIATHAMTTALSPPVLSANVGGCFSEGASPDTPPSASISPHHPLYSSAYLVDPGRVVAKSAKAFHTQRPHHLALRGLTDAEIAEYLLYRRRSFRLQLGLLFHNECGDRNIGAVVRNANAYNCEKVLVVHRRRFSRRGALGTEHYTPIICRPTLEDAAPDLDGYVCWMLHPDYPYLNLTTNELLPGFTAPLQLNTNKKENIHGKFIRHGDDGLQEWMAWQTLSEAEHPMYSSVPLRPTIHLDHDHEVRGSVDDVVRRGLKGIVLVVPEEGSTPQWGLLRVCERIVRVRHPSRLTSVHRGLNPALAAAVALHSLREAAGRWDGEP